MNDYYVKNVAEIGQFKLTIMAVIYIKCWWSRGGSRQKFNKIKMNCAYAQTNECFQNPK